MRGWLRQEGRIKREGKEKGKKRCTWTMEEGEMLEGFAEEEEEGKNRGEGELGEWFEKWGLVPLMLIKQL